VVYRLTDINIDAVDLANQIFESDQYFSVSPVFIKVMGESVSKKHSQQIQQGLQQSAPKDVEEKAEQKMEHLDNQLEHSGEHEPHPSGK